MSEKLEHSPEVAPTAPKLVCASPATEAATDEAASAILGSAAAANLAKQKKKGFEDEQCCSVQGTEEAVALLLDYRLTKCKAGHLVNLASDHFS